MPRIDLNGLESYYEIYGTGEPLVFIHGLGSSTRDWEAQVGHFSKKYQVIVYDVRGHGKTDKPSGKYSVPQFSEDLTALLDALEIGRAHICGLSMGGMIAFQFAVDHPGRIKSLTVVNQIPDMVPRTFAERKEIWQRVILFRLVSMRKIGEVIGQRLFIKPEQEDLLKLFVERWAENDKSAWLRAMRGLVGWTAAAELGNITAPALLAASDQDYTPVARKQEAVDQMPNARLEVFKDARHALPVEYADEFNRVMESFLESVGG